VSRTLEQLGNAVRVRKPVLSIRFAILVGSGVRVVRESNPVTLISRNLSIRSLSATRALQVGDHFKSGLDSTIE